MNKNLLASSLIFLLLLTTSSYGKTVSKKQDDNKKEAEKVWELAIQSEGGRNNMHKVENMLISSTGTTPLDATQKSFTQSEEFYVFPNKQWRLDDYRPSVLGLKMEMYNWETRKKYLVQKGQTTVEVVPISEDELNDAKDTNGNIMWTGMVIYLLETRWWHPVPQSVSSGKVGRKSVDIVQTILNDKRIDFYLDQYTHLPIKVSFYNSANINTIEVSKYVEIGALKLPMNLKESDGNSYKLAYQFNVDYNHDIFTYLPLTTSADAWKAKRKLSNSRYL